MLILVTGVPGSGKTLYSVGLLRKFLEEGREVFTNIDGLTLPGCFPAPDDWRDAPDGSVVVYDECQQKFGPDGQGRSARNDIQEFETHRHRGMDILLITQHPKLLHAHIRRLIGRHHHVFRMYGSETAKVFTRDGQIDVDKPSALRDQDSTMWKYPKADFEVYKSATVHTHKRRLPSWLKRSLLGLAACVCLVLFVGYQARGFFSGSLPGEEPKKEESQPLPDYQFEMIASPDQSEPEPTKPPDPVITGCITAPSRGKCGCLDGNDQWLQVTFDECMVIASQFKDKFSGW